MNATPVKWLRAFGFDLKVTLRGIRSLKRYLIDYRKFRSQLAESDKKWAIFPSYPCLFDYSDQSGMAGGHYFHQDLWVAQKIFAHQPQKHVDIGSRIDGFVAHVASFREIEVFDYRPLSDYIPNVIFRQADLLSIQLELFNYCDSLSCLHVIEHIGLGRYGDSINVNGYKEAVCSLHSILEPGGTLYLSSPIGQERIEFNAHRVFAFETLVDLFSNKFRILEISLVDDSGNLHQNVKMEDVDSRKMSFGLAIFELRKL
jgi:hypothetical protein